MNVLASHKSYNKHIYLGLVSGLVLALTELLVCLNLPAILMSRNIAVVYPGSLFIGIVLFDAVAAVAIVSVGLIACRIQKTSDRLTAAIISSLLLVGLPWLYGIGVLIQEMPDFHGGASTLRLAIIVGFSLGCVCAIAVITVIQNKIFPKGISLPIHAGIFYCTTYLMLSAARSLKGGLNLRRFFLTLIGPRDLIFILCLLAVIVLLARAWPHVRLRRGLIVGLVLCVAGVGVRLQSVINNPLKNYDPPAGRNAEKADTHPNVIIIVLDTLRADHLGCYGYERNTSPNLDKLAAESDLYLRCYSTSSWTLPSHASLFTGQYPRTHGAHRVMNSGRPLSENAETLAEILQRNGFSTGAVTANRAYLDPYFRLDQGFSFYCYDFILDRKAPFLMDVTAFTASSIFPRSRFLGALRDLVRYTRLPYPDADCVTDISLEWIDSVEKRPFFLFLNIMDTHSPYLPPMEFIRTLNGDFADVIDMEDLQEEIVGRGIQMTPEFTEDLTLLYDGSVLFVDSQVGRFLSELEERKLLDNSILIVTSDHGEFLGEHGFVDHGFALYEEVTRVPLMVRYPGQRNGAKIEHLVQIVDIMPTICEFLDIAMPEVVQGGALEKPERFSFAELYANPTHIWAFGKRFERNLEAIWEGNYHKLIEESRGSREVFDLVRDPGEQQNIADVEIEIRNRLERQLDDYRKQNSAFTSSTDASQEAPNQETLERLKALGYIK